MIEALLIACLVILIICLALLLWLVIRPAQSNLDPALVRSINEAALRGERGTREELAISRRETVEAVAQGRTEAAGAAKDLREEVRASIKGTSDTLVQSIGELSDLQKEQLSQFALTLKELTASNEVKLGEIQLSTAERLDKWRVDAAEAERRSREESAALFKKVSDSLEKELASVIASLAELTKSNEGKMELLKSAVEAKLSLIQQDNQTQLEKMRGTVEEKLENTLERRLGESFRTVSERLEAVSKGLGEMTHLASNVGDLKKVLANVNARGTWGEVQLGALLEQVLAPHQYDKNVHVIGGGEKVEFAVKLPGRNEERDEFVWLPIDSKFPVEDYRRLIAAHEAGDKELMDEAG